MKETNESKKSVVEMTDEDLSTLQAKKRQERAEKCATEVSSIMEKHNCDFDFSMIIRKGSVEPNVTIVAK